MKQLAIIVPAHNEERRIGPMLKSYLAFFKSKKLPFQIIVVLNACKDHTRTVAEHYKCKELKIIEFEQGGKGFAVTQGFKEALRSSFEYIGFVDADMSTGPEEYYRLFQQTSKCDLLIASRYVRGAIVNPKQSFQRIFVSRIFNLLIRALFLMSYRDTQCGAKIFKREALKSIVKDLHMTRWAFDVELIYQARRKGLKVREIPTKWSDKEYSQINFMKSGPKMALGVIRLRLLSSPLKGFVKIYDKIHTLVNSKK